MENSTHIPVLLESSLEELDIRKDGLYIDCTLGAGGHSEEILKRGGKVLAIEADEGMLKVSEERLKIYCPTLVRGNFKDIERIAKENDFANANGVLMDLGISNLHYEALGRGFSFKKKEEPLDLRLSTTDTNVTGATLLNVLSDKQLFSMFEPIIGYNKAKKITRFVLNRRPAEFKTVGDLVEVAREESPEVFLALRIAVNSEFDSLKVGLIGAMRVLKSGGRLVVISFHSLEDKLVSDMFREFEKNGLGEVRTKSPVIPTEKEIELNPKSRSALMRSIQKI